MPRSKYQQLQALLEERGIKFPSVRRKEARLRKVTQIKAHFIDCCYNNCIAFTGSYSDHDSCQYCKESRRNSTGKPRKRFLYIPLIQRLQLQYSDPARARVLTSYRKELHQDNGIRILRDFFDGDLFRDFHVTELGLFNDPHDIALHMSLDGVQLTNMRHYEVTPVIFLNLNLPPEERYRIANILTGVVIPGPKKPKELDTFLQPLVEELLQLDQGVQAFDGNTKSAFQLRAWVTIVTGDGPALAEAIGMKKPGNAYRPCRTCMIEAEHCNGPNKTYYVPHTGYDFTNPPIRIELREDIQLIERTRSDDYRRRFGINRSSILLQLRSLHFPRSFPADIMHCVLQNITPTLYKIWNRTKLEVDHCGDSREPYYLDAKVLEIISSSLEAARPDIPTYLGHAPRRISNHYNGFKAAEWEAWLTLFGVPLLDQHLDEDYVANFRTLGRFYSLATRHSIPYAETANVANLAEDFVHSYERLYYRGDPERLPVCTVNVHYLIHFASYIRDCGPARYWWQFPMERFCGIIKPMARSKSQLNTSLANAVVVAEHINHLQFTRNMRAATPPTVASYPVLLDCFKPHLSIYQRACLEGILEYRDPVVEGYKRCQLRRGLLVGSMQSQRRSDINRGDYRICYQEPGEHQRCFGEVQHFVRFKQFGGWAWIRTLDGVEFDGIKGVVNFQRFGSHRWIPLEWIQSLIGIIRESGVNLIVSDIDLFS